MLTSLFLVSLAHGGPTHCRTEQHHTEVRWARRPRRTDRRLFVAEADHACTVLPVPDLPDSRLHTVRARVLRADARPMVFGAERLVPTAGGWALHLPEAGEGDVVDLEVRRRLEGDTTPWAPDPARDTSLEVHGSASLWSAGASLDRWWSGRANQPVRTQVLRERPKGVVLVSAAAAPPEQGPLRADLRPQIPSGMTLALLPDPGTFLPGEPPDGRTLHATFWDTAQPSAWHPGAGAVQHACAVGPDAAEQLSAALALVVTPPSGTSVGSACAWVEGRVRVAGEQVLKGGAWRLQGPELLVWSEERGAHDRRSPAGRLVPVAPTSRGIHEGAAGAQRVVWVLPSLRGQAVLPNRSTALDRVAYAALQASLPEPGLPLSYKHRVADAAFVDALLKRVQRQVRTDVLPGRGPLRPRRLLSLKRAGWGTSWEQALLLSRLLRQARLPATPIPVRPRALGRVPPSVPVGFTDAVVFVEDADAEPLPGWGRGVFLAPTCLVCAPGELPPRLGSGQVLTPNRDTLPPSAPGVVTVDHGGSTTQVNLSPPAALSLRLALLAVAPQDRANAIPSLLGLPDTTLRSHEGLASRGQPVRLVFEGPVLGALSWREDGPAGLPGDPGLPARVTTRRRLQASPGGRFVVQDGPLRWEGRVVQEAGGLFLVEQLETDPDAPEPTSARRFGAGIAAALETLLGAAPQQPEHSTPGAPQDTLSPEVP